MDGRQALRHMVKASGKPQRAISTDIGRSEGFVQSYLATGRVPSADLMATLAHACGYSLGLVGHGETLTIGETDTGDAGGTD